MGIMKKYRKLISAAAVVLALCMLLSSSALAISGEAFVATDGLNLREGASLDYNVIDTAPRGARVTVNFDAGYGWYQVTYNGQTGYMAGYYLLFEDPAETQAQEPVQEPQAAEEASVPQEPVYQEPVYQEPVYQEPVQEPAAPATVTHVGSGGGTICADEVRLRSGPSMNSETITYLGNGTNVGVHGACGAWYEVEHNGNVGYVYGDYVLQNGESVTYTLTIATITDPTPIYTEPVTGDNFVSPTELPVQTPVEQTPVVETPSEPETPAEETPAQPVSTPHDYASGQAIVDTAMQYLGVPYVWGGTSPAGFDCSGLVYYVYGLHGISLNRVAQSMYYNGTDVDLSDLQPGDILLFGSSVYNIWHAGIYVGNGVFIHSPYSGQVVRTQGLSETFGMRLVAARRLV